MSIDSIPQLGQTHNDHQVTDPIGTLSTLNSVVNAEIEQANINFRRKIVLEILQPEYENDIRETLRLRNCWSKTSNVFFTISSVLMGITSLLSFANGQFKAGYLNYIAGCIGILAILCERFGTYSRTNDHNTTLKVNEILKNVGVNHSFVDTSKFDVPTQINDTTRPNNPPNSNSTINSKDVIVNIPKK